MINGFSFLIYFTWPFALFNSIAFSTSYLIYFFPLFAANVPNNISLFVNFIGSLDLNSSYLSGSAYEVSLSFDSSLFCVYYSTFCSLIFRLFRFSSLVKRALPNFDRRFTFSCFVSWMFRRYATDTRPSTSISWTIFSISSSNSVNSVWVSTSVGVSYKETKEGLGVSCKDWVGFSCRVTAVLISCKLSIELSSKLRLFN